MHVNDKKYMYMYKVQVEQPIFGDWGRENMCKGFKGTTSLHHTPSADHVPYYMEK